MITVRLAGGLGNQLFQTMTALLLSKRLGQPVLLLTQALGRYAAVRQPDVLRLIGSDRLLRNVVPSQYRWQSWAALQLRAGRWVPAWGFSDANFPGDLDRPARWALVDGHFQRGWNDFLIDEARCLAQLAPVVETPEAPSFDCVLHIRGSDFLGLPQYAFLATDHYERGVALAWQEGCRRFAIVTDDSAHARRLLTQLQHSHPEANFLLMPSAADALQDFQTLRAAPCRIIGNSTFAWWASALGVRGAITWAPDCFTRDVVRDYFLPGERCLRNPAPAFATVPSRTMMKS